MCRVVLSVVLRCGVVWCGVVYTVLCGVVLLGFGLGSGLG